MTTTATAAPAATATKTAIVLAPVNDLTRKRTEEYNAIATELGGHVKFALVNSDKSFEDIVRASAGGIAITTPVYRAIREGLINDLVQKVPTIKLVQAASAGTDRFARPDLGKSPFTKGAGTTPGSGQPGNAGLTKGTTGNIGFRKDGVGNPTGTLARVGEPHRPPIRLGEQAGSERPQVECPVVEDSGGLRVGRVVELESPIEGQSVDVVRAHASADIV